MAAVITATAQPANVPPRVFLNVTGVSGTAVTVYRRNPDGSLSPVANANPGLLTAGALLVYDYLGPVNAAVTYVAVPSNGSAQATSASVTLTGSDSWLASPGNPNASVRITEFHLTDDTETITADIGIHEILDSDVPMLVYPALRKTPTSQGTIATSTSADMIALDALLKVPVPLLMRIVGLSTATNLYQWVMVTQYTKSRAGMAFESLYREYALQWRVCAVPLLLSTAQRTMGDIAAEASTGTMAYFPAHYLTMQGIATGVLGT